MQFHNFHVSLEKNFDISFHEGSRNQVDVVISLKLSYTTIMGIKHTFKEKYLKVNFGKWINSDKISVTKISFAVNPFIAGNKC